MHEIILVDFKFGNFLQNCQFAELTSPKFPTIQYVYFIEGSQVLYN